MDAQACPLMLSICLVIVHYLSSQYWQIKLWRIANYLPIPQSFLLPRFCAVRYIKNPELTIKNLANYKHHNKQQPTQ